MFDNVLFYIELTVDYRTDCSKIILVLRCIYRIVEDLLVAVPASNTSDGISRTLSVVIYLYGPRLDER